MAETSHSPGRVVARALAWALPLAIVAGTAMRLVLLPAGPEGWDAVDFLLALDEYDLARFQPHFPGYPLYVVLGRLTVWLGLEPETALRAIGAVAGGLLPLPIWALLRGGDPDWGSDGRALAAAVGVSLLAALLLASVRIEADLAALLVALIALWAARVGRPGVAGLVAAAALGVRPGALPLVAGVWALAIAGARSKRTAALLFGGAVAGGVLAWWLPQVIVVGPVYFREALAFTAGHFVDWGGTAVTDPEPARRLGACAVTLWRGLGAGGGAGAVTTVAVGLFLAGGAALYLTKVRDRWRRDLWILCLGVPQVVAVLLFQNPYRMRHHEGVVLAVALAAALGWLAAGGRSRWVGCLLLALLAGNGIALLGERRGTVPPSLAAARSLTALAPGPDTWVFCGESARLFAVADPGGVLVVRRARDLDGAVREVNMHPRPPQRVLAFSEVAGQNRMGRAPACQWRGDPRVYDDAAVAVYSYRVVASGAGASLTLEPAPRASPAAAGQHGGAREEEVDGAR